MRISIPTQMLAVKEMLSTKRILARLRSNHQLKYCAPIQIVPRLILPKTNAAVIVEEVWDWSNSHKMIRWEYCRNRSSIWRWALLIDKRRRNSNLILEVVHLYFMMVRIVRLLIKKHSTILRIITSKQIVRLIQMLCKVCSGSTNHTRNSWRIRMQLLIIDRIKRRRDHSIHYNLKILHNTNHMGNKWFRTRIKELININKHHTKYQMNQMLCRVIMICWIRIAPAKASSNVSSLMRQEPVMKGILNILNNDNQGLLLANAWEDYSTVNLSHTHL